jgi:hypothetical protein
MRYVVISFLSLLSVLSGPMWCAYADDAPAGKKATLKRKPGLWEVSMTADGKPAPTSMRQCADESTDATMMQMSEMQAENCKVNDFSKTDVGYEFRSECEMAGTKVVSNGVFSGDFDSEYRGEINTTMTPPLFGRGETKSTISAKWLGACPEGMKPGEMQLDNGIKMDLEQAKQGAKMAAEMMKNPEMQKAIKNAISGANGDAAAMLKGLTGSETLGH